MVTTLTVTFDHSIDHIVRSEEVEIPAGGFYSFDINRDELLEQGEPGTGRLQLWIEVVIVSRNARTESLSTHLRINRQSNWQDECTRRGMEDD
jgi:hypothetical protein